MQTQFVDVTEHNEKLVLQNGIYLTVEAPLQIMINKKPFAVTMRTPGNDSDLLHGLLFAEQIWQPGQPIDLNEEQCPDAEYVQIIHVDLPQSTDIPSRSLSSVSSCGMCGKQHLDDCIVSGNQIETNALLSPTHIDHMLDQMKKKQSGFLKSGGSHAAALFDHQYKPLAIREDIGRHNAVDKVIGSWLQTDQTKSPLALCISGRISYEIVAKAYCAKIPFVFGVSAASSMAVSMANALGITLGGFCRENRSTIYSHAQRIET